MENTVKLVAQSEYVGSGDLREKSKNLFIYAKECIFEAAARIKEKKGE